MVQKIKRQKVIVLFGPQKGLTKLILKVETLVSYQLLSYPYQICVEIACDAVVITFGACFERDKARFGIKSEINQ